YLICKHVVQGLDRVPPVFFLEVKRQRTVPFWAHPSLRLPPLPAELTTSNGAGELGTRDSSVEDVQDAVEGWDDDDDDLVDMRAGDDERLTFLDTMDTHIDVIVEFARGLKFQRQFRDQRMLQVLEREGAPFLRLARACLEKEKRMRSTRGSTPSTWDRSGISAMYY
ncbi:hypothetical protein DFH08DRAFT_683692, partial [Mycena albidolilacea]